jgi:hypothetical protein
MFTLIVAVLFLIACQWLVIHYTKSLIAQDKILFVLIFLVVLLAGSWAIDNVIMPNIQLLDAEENKTILQIMNSIVNLVLGYYLGSKKADDKS